MTDEIKKELSSLLGEVKEQVLYLTEIGVGNFDVSLPEVTLQTEEPAQENVIGTEIPRERLEKFIPDDPIVGKISIKPEAPARKNLGGLLQQTRLSQLPEIPKRNSLSFVKTKDPKAENEMAPKEEKSELLNDVNAALPESGETIEQIRGEIGSCTRCPLHTGRTQIVHSTGDFQADLMFIGEAPGADEDAQGEPFVGRAGKLLTKIIEGIGLRREDVFIGNINRCRPPENRQPSAEESDACKPYLLREIAVVRPKVIVVLGNTATKNLLDTKIGITKLRGNFQEYYGVKVMPTFHPAYLLRDPRKKREVWEDMKMVRDEIKKTE